MIRFLLKSEARKVYISIHLQYREPTLLVGISDMARDREESENFGMVLGLVKTIKLESIDSSIRKSMDFMQNSINELSRTISSMQTSIASLSETMPLDILTEMSTRLVETMHLYNEANEALIHLTLTHLESTLSSRAAFSTLNANIPEEPSESTDTQEETT